MANASKIKDSLVSQLENKGANIEAFSSLIDDYLWYWKQEKALQKDIAKRGYTYKAISAAGKEYEKENPSLKYAVMYNKQKLAILKELGLTTNNIMVDDEL